MNIKSKLLNKVKTIKFLAFGILIVKILISTGVSEFIKYTHEKRSTTGMYLVIAII